MILRPYQSECVDAVYHSFDVNRSVLAVLATGLGKTVIGSAVIGEWVRRQRPGRILWLAHREELIDQAAQAIRHFTGLHVSVEMGDSFADEYGFAPSPVVLGSVQTLARFRRRRKFKPERFGLLITDEAHHAPARSYRKIYEYFREGNEEGGIVGNPQIRHLGITATPKRADDLAMGRVFDHVAYDYGIEPAVRDGWLVPVRQAVAIVANLDLSKVKVIGGDFSADQLEQLLTEQKVVLRMCQPVIENCADKPALVFCVGVAQSKAMCDVLNARKPGSAAWVSGTTPKEERRRIIADFKAKRLQFVCNCGVFTEGFDAPATSWVVMARPTKSLPLYVQMLGRATRPLPDTVEGLTDVAARQTAIAHSAKPYCSVLDFVGNAQTHGAAATISAADVLGGNYSEETKQYAKQSLKGKPGVKPIEEVLDRADAELALLREEAERKARLVAEVDYQVRYLDTPTSGPRREHDTGKRGEPATDKQVWKLIHLGISRRKAESFTKRQASKVISKLLEKQGVKA